MRVRTFGLILTLLGAMLFLAAPAGAITMGQNDGDLHPNVGALIAEYDTPGVKDLLCTGTLISPTVFLTASHCTEFLPSVGVDPDEVWVTFDSSYDSGSTLIGGTYFTHPQYGDSPDTHDIAVVVLDHAVALTPAALPRLNELGIRLGNKSLRRQRFTAVGYGTARDIKTGGPNAFYFDGARRFATQSFHTLGKIWLRLNMNPSTGSGGTCYGDSGGPHFLGNTNKIVSITITGDTACRATDVTYRLDTRSARAFMGDFVTLP